MLTVDHINVFYGDLQALWDVSLLIGDGEIVTLIGSNGSGKTTILRTLCGLLKPRNGTIVYRGIHTEQLSPHKIVEHGICMVPEGRGLFPEMSVLEHLELGAFAFKARHSRHKTLEWVYHIFPILKSRASQRGGTLSGGEQQMLAIGRALMSQPSLLILDEMSLGLAPVIVETLSQVIQQINESKKTTIFLVEQNVTVALDLANRAYIIENGRIVGEGEAKALRESGEIKDAYLGVGTVLKG